MQENKDKTTQENVELINAVLFEEYASITESIGMEKGPEVNVVFRTMGGTNQLEMEKEMSTVEGSRVEIVHIYSLKLLSRTVLKYGDIEFKNTEEAYNYFSPKTASLLDALVNKQAAFEKRIKELITPKGLEENFSPTPPATPE